jgi:formate dehydrogenase major subunit
VAAISDTHAAEAAMENTDLTVQISTKLNRSHTVTGKEALILPTMGRTEIDLQESGPQFVSVEDTVCAVHPSAGRVEPVAPNLLSEVAIVCRMARETVAGKSSAGWAGSEKNYDLIREHISHVVAGYEDYNSKIRQGGGFVCPTDRGIRGPSRRPPWPVRGCPWRVRGQRGAGDEEATRRFVSHGQRLRGHVLPGGQRPGAPG